MKKKILFLFLILSTNLFSQNKNHSIGFIENKGQIIDQKGKTNNAVKYLLNTNGLNVQIRNNGFSYDIYETKKHKLSKKEINKQNPFLDPINENNQFQDYKLEYIYHRIDIDFLNSNKNTSIIPTEKSIDYDNYYNVIGKPEGVLNVYKYQQITYKNIYPNIDVVFSIPKDSLKPVEYNFVVRPNGKVSDIQLQFKGSKTELVDNKIKMKVRFGEMEEILPKSWIEETNKDNTEIAIGYKKISKNIYGFESDVSILDKTLIIDPVPIRLWGTYYGGSGDEFPNSIVIDNLNNIYLSGTTTSTTNIATSGTYQDHLYNLGAGFITKLNTNGNRIWGTYYQANLLEIKVDSNLNVYATGNALYSLNIASIGSFQPIKNNYNDAYLIKLNIDGTRDWATYYGGNGNDYGDSICFDLSNNVYLSGTTSSTDLFFATTGAHQSINNSEINYQDAFIVKFDPSGNRIWGTFYGGLGSESFFNIFFSDDGFLYASGTQNSNANIATPNSYQPIGQTTGSGGMIVKFDQNGTRIWGTYINNNSYITNAVLKGNNIYLTGIAFNNGIGTSGTFYENHQPLPQESALSSNENSYIVKFNIQTQQKIWGTYFVDQIRGIDINQNDEVIFSGTTFINSGVTTPDSYMPIKNSYCKDFIIKLNSLGQRVWGTYVGGNFAEQVGIIKIDNNQDIYLYGMTNGSTTGIATTGAHQTTLGSNPDTFLNKFKDCQSSTTTSSNTPTCLGSNLNLTASGGTNYAWTGPNGFSSSQQNPIITNATTLNSGQYSCTIAGTAGCDGVNTINVVVGDLIKPIPNIATLPTINGDCNTTITATTATDNCAGTITATTIDPLNYSLPGTYTIHWNYNDGNGNIETQNQTVEITSVLLPTLISPQFFCIQQNATLNSIAITGQNIKWYDAQTGGNLLLNTTTLVNGTTYYASQTINNCESLRVPVVINIQNTLAPTGNSNQSFCSTQNATLSNINITGTAINWYSSNSSITILPATTILVNGSSYYATQIVNGCESVNRLAVAISLINTLNATNYSDSLCDDLNDDSEIIDLSSYTSNIITNATGCTFEYYNSSLGATNQDASYQISTISNYNLTVGQQIIYVRITSTNSCSQIIELQLSLYAEPVIAINDIMPICYNQTITINAGTGFNSYLWSNGAITPSISVDTAGSYNVIVTQNHGVLTCTSIKNFEVVTSNIASITTIETTDWTDNENTITVLLSDTSIGNYEYSLDGLHYQISNVFTGLINGVYQVSVRDINGCGIVEDEIYLLTYPKYFTPNGDGINDFWKINFSQYETNLTLKIVDRYGKFIKKLNYLDIGWDGTYNGQQLPSDDYWFVVTRANGKEYKGHFAVKR